MVLTDKKSRFAKAVVAGKTNKQAAILAGYSAATASAAGSRLVKDPLVVEEVARLQGLASAAVAPPAGVDPEPTRYTDPVRFLTDVMNDQRTTPSLRVDAAKALLRANRQERELPIGKKEAAAARAGVAAKGRFGVRPAPLKLVGNGG